MPARGIWPGVLAVALGLGAATGACAQVPPLAAEVLAYDGLHQAAWHGDLARLKGLVASGANLDARDARGRTPLHVATYARQREAIRLLAKAGAKLDLLEDDRYDASPSRRWPTTPTRCRFFCRSAPMPGRPPAATTARR